MADAEKWAAGMPVPAYAIDDQTAIKVIDGTVEVVSEGTGSCLPALRAPGGDYAQGRRAQLGGRSRRNRSTVAYACLQSEVSSATLAP